MNPWPLPSSPLVYDGHLSPRVEQPRNGIQAPDTPGTRCSATKRSETLLLANEIHCSQQIALRFFRRSSAP